MSGYYPGAGGYTPQRLLEVNSILGLETEVSRQRHRRTPPDAISYSSFRFNPLHQMEVAAGKGLGSNCVTPKPVFIPNLQDIDWLVGIAGIIFGLLGSGDDYETDRNTSIERVDEIIDMNNFLPTTDDDYRDWAVVAGTGGTGRV